MTDFFATLQTYLSKISGIRIADIVEIIIISFLIYSILAWIKKTRAWSILKGILVIILFVLIAEYFEMNTILWIVNNLFSVALIAVIIILQPELRKAVEELGRKRDFLNFIPFEFNSRGSETERFSDKTVYEITRACVEMGKVKTGVLIVIEQDQDLSEYERTGIDVDAVITSQLLINIFEKNTPLHDGAVLIRGNRVVSATCYLPLSDNRSLSKDLGTRHRAAVGMSEVSDAMIVVVSEETGKISVAYEGSLYRNLDAEGLKEKLSSIQNKQTEEESTRKLILWKGRAKGEK